MNKVVEQGCQMNNKGQDKNIAPGFQRKMQRGSRIKWLYHVWGPSSLLTYQSHLSFTFHFLKFQHLLSHDTGLGTTWIRVGSSNAAFVQCIVMSLYVGKGLLWFYILYHIISILQLVLDCDEFH